MSDTEQAHFRYEGNVHLKTDPWLAVYRSLSQGESFSIRFPTAESAQCVYACGNMITFAFPNATFRANPISCQDNEVRLVPDRNITKEENGTR